MLIYVSCDLELNLSRNSLPDLLQTPCRPDMYLDDACALTIIFKHNGSKFIFVSVRSLCVPAVFEFNQY